MQGPHFCKVANRSFHTAPCPAVRAPEQLGREHAHGGWHHHDPRRRRRPAPAAPSRAHPGGWGGWVGGWVCCLAHVRPACILSPAGQLLPHRPTRPRSLSLPPSYPYHAPSLSPPPRSSSCPSSRRRRMPRAWPRQCRRWSARSRLQACVCCWTPPQVRQGAACKDHGPQLGTVLAGAGLVWCHGRLKQARSLPKLPATSSRPHWHHGQVAACQPP